MSDKNPRLEIPVSPSMRQLIPVEIELLYDEPYEYEGEQWNTYYYTVLSGGGEYSLRATTGLHNRIQATGAGKGSVLSIARVGEKKDTRWDIDFISGPQKQPQAPQPKTGSPSSGSHKPARSTSKPQQALEFYPMEQDDLNTMLEIARNYLEVYTAMLTLVAVDPQLGELPHDQQQRIATGTTLHAYRTYKKGMVVAGAQEASVLNAYTNAITQLDSEDGLVDGVIDALVTYTDMPNRKTVTDLLRDFGMSSNTILAGSTEEHITLFRICTAYSELIQGGTDNATAKTHVAERFNIEYDEPPF